MDENTEYVSHIFNDGDILTAGDMNNIILGIDENAEKIKNLNNLAEDIVDIDQDISNLESSVTTLQNRVPQSPAEDGTYWLSSSQPSNVYRWVQKSAVTVYEDPDEDGNIIVS